MTRPLPTRHQPAVRELTVDPVVQMLSVIPNVQVATMVMPHGSGKKFTGNAIDIRHELSDGNQSDASELLCKPSECR